MRFKMRIQSIEENNNIVTVHFVNGEKLSVDLLIGCDGIHSPTRAYVVGKDIKPNFANVSVIIGASKLSKEEGKALRLTKGLHFFFGEKCNLGVGPFGEDGTWGW